MLFNSTQFIIFLPICIILYFVMPMKVRNLFLLAASYFFYMCWAPQYVLLLMFSTFITWLCGFRVEKAGGGLKYRRAWLAGTVILNIGILFLFKYFNFFGAAVSAVLGRAGFMVSAPRLSLLLPVGISFYTFQSLGYSIDVYRGEIKHERNLIDYALFVSFFPQLVAGPIERSKNLLPQFKERHTFSTERAEAGLRIVLVGMFKKIVVADMAAMYVDAVFARLDLYQGLTLALAVFLFTVQIYCDFSGYSDVARGTALILGFRLMENFSAPYFSGSITEFWSRWHISLSTWLRDYIYIPLGGNRKGFIRKCMNLMVVFLVSGLWHGANMTYVVWGGVHGVFRVLEECLRRIRSGWAGGKPAGEGFQRLKAFAGVIYCFCVVQFAWIFFRASSLTEAVNVIRKLFCGINIRDFGQECLLVVTSIMPDYSWGAAAYLGILCFAVVFICLLDYKKRFRGLAAEAFVAKQRTAVRWLLYYTMILTTMFCFVMTTNEYGQAGAFLYFQF